MFVSDGDHYCQSPCQVVFVKFSVVFLINECVCLSDCVCVCVCVCVFLAAI